MDATALILVELKDVEEIHLFPSKVKHPLLYRPLKPPQMRGWSSRPSPPTEFQISVGKFGRSLQVVVDDAKSMISTLEFRKPTPTRSFVYPANKTSRTLLYNY